MHATLPLMRSYGFPALRRGRTETLQVNLGYKCNQSCLHWHVNAGPTRTEMMSAEVLADVFSFLAVASVRKLDITGGAPELHPRFRDLVLRARELGAHVIDRCNLTILGEPGQEDLDSFLAENKGEITASLPCYTPELVDRQRGKGVYERSIEGLKRLNALGYAAEGSGLVLNLVYNPQGPSLPPPQEKLEADYKRILGETHGVRFNRLFTLANMPIQRFGSTLISKGQFNDYMALLHRSHSDANLESVMCRSLISVDWQGYVFNGGFHWFDVHENQFSRIDDVVARYCATRGNVETELAAEVSAAGCGCGYPEWVDDDTVSRSNSILEKLRETAMRFPQARARLAALPMHLVAAVGGERVAVVHGDGDSLAGWGFSQESLSSAEGQAGALRNFEEAGVRVFASSHTCLPVLQSFPGERAIVNNGAAGMPNFRGTQFRIATRISVRPSVNA